MNELDILARTIYGEARGEYKRHDGGLASLIAVGNVIMNRVNKGGWFGSTVIDVCHRPLQFSCWNPKDPNRTLILSDFISKDPVFEVCHEVAQKLLEGTWPDLTKGSNHYHASYCKPGWAAQADLAFKIGSHMFYKIGS